MPQRPSVPDRFAATVVAARQDPVRPCHGRPFSSGHRGAEHGVTVFAISYNVTSLSLWRSTEESDGGFQIQGSTPLECISDRRTKGMREQMV